jgi:hypothetical protein
MAEEVGSLTSQRKGSGQASWGEQSWHQIAAHPYPANFNKANDAVRFIIDHVVRGYTPDQPPLRQNDSVVTLGSCFAGELRHFLNQVGLSSDSFWVPSGLNNTFALLDFISWCITGQQTGKGFRYERNPEGDIKDWLPTQERKQYLENLGSAGAFVFTLGLAEVWEDTQTNKVFWRGVPNSIFENDRHRFRVSTVEENRQNLGQIISLLRSINPIAPIVLTLSPVPLKATFQDFSCMAADCISKSILRVAISETMNEIREQVFYWPSFEIVKWGGCHFPYPVYGTDDGVVRHVSRFLVMNILLEFIRYFYGESTCSSVRAIYEDSIAKDKGGEGEPPLLIRGNIISA